MKYSEMFAEKIGCYDEQAVFKYLLTTLKDSISSWDYFVDWAKINESVSKIEMDLNLLNYLIGKDNIESEFTDLLRRYPQVARLVPILVAYREKDVKLLANYGYNGFEYREFSFRKKVVTETEISETVEFAIKSGFLAILASKRIKSVVDYVFGVEVGMDTNARKNRSGKTMERIVEFYVADICTRNNWRYLSQASATKIKNEWGMDVPVDKSRRIVDFVVDNGENLYLIEANYYGGGGSKLKSTAGEYIAMHDFWTKAGLKFIWVTDGKGWETAHLPLRETFNKTDFVLNLDMVSEGLLEEIILKEF